jgi:hypothetical protein
MVCEFYFVYSAKLQIICERQQKKNPFFDKEKRIMEGMIDKRSEKNTKTLYNKIKRCSLLRLWV